MARLHGRRLLPASFVLFVACTTSTTPTFPHRLAIGALLATVRPFEARISGEVRYRECRLGPDRGSLPAVQCQNPGLSEGTLADLGFATAALSRLSSQPRPADEIWAGAVADLAVGITAEKLERVIGRLEEVVGQDTTNAAALNDLAVAYFASAGLRQRARDLFEALDRLERAVAVDSGSAEIAFNHALVLERLTLVGESTAAWRRFLRLDQAGGWAAEAAHHLAALERADRQPPATARLATGIAEGLTGPMLRQLATEEPEAARDFVIDTLFLRWANAVEHSDSTEALRMLRSIAMTAKTLQGNGDSSVVRAVTAIETTTAADRPTLAAALVRFAKGRDRFRKGDYLAARVDLAAAVVLWGRARLDRSSRMALAGPARILHAATEIYHGHLERGSVLHERLSAELIGLPYPALAAQTEWGLGIVRFRQGRFREAIAHYRRSAELFRTIGDESGLAAIEGQLAECYHRTGQDELALRSGMTAVRLLKARRDRTYLHNSLSALSYVLEERGSVVAAHAVNREALRVAGRTGRVKDPLEAAASFSHTAAALGQTEAGRATLLAATAALPTVTDSGMRARLAVELVRTTAELEAGANPSANAARLEFVSRYYRTQGFVGNLSPALVEEARAQLAAGDTAGSERTTDEALRLFAGAQKGSLDRLTEAAAGDVRASLFRQLAELRIARSDTAGAWAALERLRLVAMGRDRAAPSPASIAARLEPSQVLLGYWVRGLNPIVWVVRRDTVVVRALSVPESQLGAAVTRFRNLIQLADDSTATGALAAEIFDQVLAPVADLIESRADILLVADGALTTLPFAALRQRATGRYLIQDHRLRFLAAMSDARGKLGRLHPNDRTMVVDASRFERTQYPGLSALRGAASEVAAILAARSTAVVLADSLAQLPVVLAALPKYQVFHFVGHARSIDGAPALSHLVLPGPLGADGSLYGGQILGLDLRGSRLVVLSACSTHPGSNRDGLPVSGLGRAFLIAGAADVVSSLWEVDDLATAQLMGKFYRALGSMTDAAEALSAAQTAMIESPDPTARQPRSWATFRLETGGRPEIEHHRPSH